MIIVDLNQITYTSLTVHSSKENIDENLVRHVVLNSLRLVRNRFFDKYGEMIIASDSKHYWRKDVFPYYKANRKKDRDASILNWPVIFDCMNNVKRELKETFPYKFIDVYGAEADDIISVIVQTMDFNEKALIISGDKDFIQLHSLKPHVDQYDPIRQRWAKHPNPSHYLQEHVIRGDRGDGIPNIRTSDSSLVTGERQKTISAKMLNAWLAGGIPRELQRNYQRNKTLIDLSQMPTHIREDIITEFHKEPVGDRQKLYRYFIDHGLKNLMENIQEF